MHEELDRVASQLDGISETLADLGISALRDALDDPDSDGKRPEVEKRIARARRSVEKAAFLLRGEPTSGLI